MMGKNLLLNYAGQIKISYAIKLKEAVAKAQQLVSTVANTQRFLLVRSPVLIKGSWYSYEYDNKGSAIAQMPTRPSLIFADKKSSEGKKRNENTKTVTH